MEIDIVARLREAGGGYFVSQLHEQAAEEIERLRAGGCARDQRITQHCAEAAREAETVVSLLSTIERIRKAANLHGEMLEKLPDAIGRIRQERDDLKSELDAQGNINA